MSHTILRVCVSLVGDLGKSVGPSHLWIPAFAGMTTDGVHLPTKLIQHPIPIASLKHYQAVL